MKCDKQFGLCFDGDLSNRSTVTSLRWKLEDVQKFGINNRQVGKLVFEPEIRPVFMSDARFD